MTGPAREEIDPKPDDYNDSDPSDQAEPGRTDDSEPLEDLGPLPSPERQPDLWDQEEGVPTDVEDIAIVCHEALRAYRTTQGSGSGRPWMNQTQEERNNLVELVHRHMHTKPRNEKLIGPPEALLVAHIVKALAR